MHRLTFEQLERRELLSITVNLIDTETVRLDGVEMTAGEFSYDSPVGPVNVVVNPLAVGDSYEAVEDEPLVVEEADGVGANDPGFVQSVLVAGPTHGVLMLDLNGSFIYMPDANYFGSDYFLYDSEGVEPALVTLSVANVNDPPATVDDVFQGKEDEALVTGSVLSNDTDVDGDPLSIESFAQPVHGAVTHEGNGIFAYMPDADWFGTDEFTYVATDGEGGTDSATVTIEVAAVNDRPIAQADDRGTRVGKVLRANSIDGLLTNDTDVDGDTLGGIVIVTQPAHGQLTIMPSSGAFIYIPDAEYVGVDSFTYTVQDDQGAVSEPALVTIEIVDSSDPILRSDVYVSGPSGITIDAAEGVSANDRPTDLVVSIVTAPLHGTIVMAGDGSFVYTPDEGYVGADSFKYAAGGEKMQSAIWAQAAPLDVPPSVLGNMALHRPVSPQVPVLGGGSIYDVAFHELTRRPNWSPVLLPEYVDSLYGSYGAIA